jgi:hypothetical protein
MHTVCTPVLLGGAEPDEDTLKQTFESSPQPAGAGNDEDGKPLDSARTAKHQNLQTFEWHAPLATTTEGWAGQADKTSLREWYGSVSISDRLQGQSEEIEVSRMQQLDAVGCCWMQLVICSLRSFMILSFFV